jgi:hypothetical protein
MQMIVRRPMQFIPDADPTDARAGRDDHPLRFFQIQEGCDRLSDSRPPSGARFRNTRRIPSTMPVLPKIRITGKAKTPSSQMGGSAMLEHKKKGRPNLPQAAQV